MRVEVIAYVKLYLYLMFENKRVEKDLINHQTK